MPAAIPASPSSDRAAHSTSTWAPSAASASGGSQRPSPRTKISGNATEETPPRRPSASGPRGRRQGQPKLRSGAAAVVGAERDPRHPRTGEGEHTCGARDDRERNPRGRDDVPYGAGGRQAPARASGTLEERGAETGVAVHRDRAATRSGRRTRRWSVVPPRGPPREPVSRRRGRSPCSANGRATPLHERAQAAREVPPSAHREATSRRRKPASRTLGRGRRRSARAPTRTAATPRSTNAPITASPAIAPAA